MATAAEIIARVRLELGDLGEPFRSSYEGDGSAQSFQLPVQHVSSIGLSVFTIAGATLTTLAPSAYTLDEGNGLLRTTAAFPYGTNLVVQGTSYGLFSDAELGQFVNDAVLQHTNGRTITSRYRDTNGFIQYREDPVELANLPEVENLLVALLATVEALWALATDASTDIDVITAEGTHLPRSQRWAQIMRQIDVLTDKYHGLCEQLNVGLNRIEVSTLRRVSLQTGRLVPVFKTREYDDNTLPQRLLPPIDHRHDDESGIPSQIIGGNW